jgi:hypothetical protein
MTSDVSSSTTHLRGEHSPLGSPAQVRVFLFVLVSVLAGTFELVLLLTLRSAHLSPRQAILFYFLPLLHLLPWFAGLTCWSKVRHALVKGAISTTAADLCYSVIIALLSTSYVVLCSFELSLAQSCALTH